MSRHQGFLLCAFAALSTVLLASVGQAPAAPGSSPATDAATERGVPALFSWGDVDGDGRLDLAAVCGNGMLQLLANAGDGRFEDVTERLGLSEVKNAALALWADYDGDGRFDLFVGAREGASWLFHNEGGAFVDTSATSGLSSQGAVHFAQWLDHDGDGRLDLFVVTAQKNELFRGLEGGFFEVAEVPLAFSTPTSSAEGAPIDPRNLPRGGGTPHELPDANPERDGPHTRGSAPAKPSASGSRSVLVTGVTPSGPHAPAAPAAICRSPDNTDQAGGLCIEASRDPM
jgi:hypothetical protein